VSGARGLGRKEERKTGEEEEEEEEKKEVSTVKRNDKE